MTEQNEEFDLLILMYFYIFIRVSVYINVLRKTFLSALGIQNLTSHFSYMYANYCTI